MPTHSKLNLLFISKIDVFSQALMDELEKSGLEVIFVPPNDIASTLFEKANFDYVVVNAYSSDDSIELLLDEEKISNLVTFSRQTETKLLFLVRDILDENIIERIIEKIQANRINNTTTGFLLISEYVDKTEGIRFEKKEGKVLLPQKESFLSYAYTDDIIKVILRSIFSLKAYGHIQKIVGVSLRSEELSNILSERSIKSTFLPVTTKQLSLDEETIHLPLSIQDILPVNEKLQEEVTEENIVQAFHPFRLAEEVSHHGSVVFDYPNQEVRQETRDANIKKNKKTASLSFIGKIRRNKTQKKKKRIARKGRRGLKKITAVLVFFISVLLFPYFLATTSLFFTVFIANQLEKGRSTYEPINTFAVWYSEKSERVSSWYLMMNDSGSLYSDSLNLSRISLRTALAQGEKQKMSKDLADFYSQIFADKEVSLSPYASSISFSLDAIYSELGFVLSEYNDLTWTKSLMTYAFKEVAIHQERQTALLYKSIVQDMPGLLGEAKPITYAVVLQNDKIVRATGGLVEGVALVTIDKGMIENIEVIETKDYQSKIGGEVTPPYAISTYLGKPNWLVADANWDYDYRYTAERLQWFIEKEFDREVEGVVSVNKSAVEKLLKDKDKDVPSDVSTILTAGISELTDLLKKKNERKLIELLSDKQILIDVPSETSQNALSELGWNNSFAYQMCEENCLFDRVSINESNFGNENDGIKREGHISVSYEEGLIKRKLIYYLQNNGAEDYKSFVRLIAPKEAGFSPVTLITTKEKRILDPHVFGNREEKEAGVFIEVPKNQTVGLEFIWESTAPLDLSKEGYYDLFIQKQPGVAPYPLRVTVSIPIKEPYTLSSHELLTKGSSLEYNTVLARDLTSRILWNQK